MTELEDLLKSYNQHLHDHQKLVERVNELERRVGVGHQICIKEIVEESDKTHEVDRVIWANS